MSGKKREVRCDGETITVRPVGATGWSLRHQCVLRAGHVGQCLAWIDHGSGYESVRWAKPLPTPCGRAVHVAVGYADTYALFCERPTGHGGPCEVTL